MKDEKSKHMIALFLMFLGLCLILFGTLRGEEESVLQKAINICMECIGIG